MFPPLAACAQANVGRFRVVSGVWQIRWKLKKTKIEKLKYRDRSAGTGSQKKSLRNTHMFTVTGTVR
jgi:hypothetical protein